MMTMVDEAKKKKGKQEILDEFMMNRHKFQQHLLDKALERIEAKAKRHFTKEINKIKANTHIDLNYEQKNNYICE